MCKRPQLNGKAVDVFLAYYKELDRNEMNSGLWMSHYGSSGMRGAFLSKKFLSSMRRLLHGSTIRVHLLNDSGYMASNLWSFDALVKDQCFSDLGELVIRLIRPQFDHIVWNHACGPNPIPVKKHTIDALVGIRKLTIDSEYSDPHSHLLIQNLWSELQSLECSWQHLDLQFPLAKMHEYKMPLDSQPCNFNVVLKHSFRRIHLKISVNDYIDLYSNPHLCRYVFDESICPVQPSVEELLILNERTFRGILLPLTFYGHVPNLQKIFYSSVFPIHGVQSSLNQQPLVEYICNLSENANSALRHGNQIKSIVLEVSVRSKVQKQMTEFDWLKKLAELEFFTNKQWVVSPKSGLKLCEENNWCPLVAMTKSSTHIMKCVNDTITFFINVDLQTFIYVVKQRVTQSKQMQDLRLTNDAW
ncbi:hypothetical protein M3Y98_00037900 [Aphelenchoides besseyi]|nr:hypothetical protein M3Y98_00037900 [Aphelenchoides besseyi]